MNNDESSTESSCFDIPSGRRSNLEKMVLKAEFIARPIAEEAALDQRKICFKTLGSNSGLGHLDVVDLERLG